MGLIVEEDVVSEERVVEHFGVVENNLSQLSNQYVELAPHQQVAVRRTLQEMLDLPSHCLLSPLRQERTRGRPIGATNRRSNDNSSTRREPSGFELVRGAGVGAVRCADSQGIIVAPAQTGQHEVFPLNMFYVTKPGY